MSAEIEQHARRLAEIGERLLKRLDRLPFEDRVAVAAVMFEAALMEVEQPVRGQLFQHFFTHIEQVITAPEGEN